MTDFVQIMTAIDSKEAAQSIARALVERRLAGCVQVIGPISSTYRWEGGIESDEEWLCLIKSRLDFYHDVETAIHELHTYDVPEILALPVIAGSGPYVHWLAAQIDSPEDS